MIGRSLYVKLNVSRYAKAEKQEQHASFLEENLLMQLRAATKGRIYDIWVHRTKIRIRVGQFLPAIALWYN
jgi:hypothetical protein